MTLVDFFLSPEVLNGEVSSPAFRLFQQDTDRMSRFLTTTTASVLLLGAAGCYQPMYQPYGQPMYGPGYAQPGTMVVPPGNAPLYQPGAAGTSNPSTFEQDDSGTDDFKRDSNNGQFFERDPVPTPKDPSATDSGTQKFNSDFGN